MDNIYIVGKPTCNCQDPDSQVIVLNDNKSNFPFWTNFDSCKVDTNSQLKGEQLCVNCDFKQFIEKKQNLGGDKLVSETYTGNDLSNIDKFKNHPTYNTWKKFPDNIKKDLIETSKKNLINRTGKTVMNELILRYSKISSGSIYKKNNQVGELTELYFQQSNRTKDFAKKYNDEIVGWMGELITALFKTHLDYGIWTGYKQQQIDIDKFKKIILRCAKEMLYDKIRVNGNRVDLSLLQSMGVSCVTIAMKLILQYDSIYDKKLTEQAIEFCDGACALKTVKKMEIDLLVASDYQGCYEVRRRLNDSKEPGTREAKPLKPEEEEVEEVEDEEEAEVKVKEEDEDEEEVEVEEQGQCSIL